MEKQLLLERRLGQLLKEGHQAQVVARVAQQLLTVVLDPLPAAQLAQVPRQRALRLNLLRQLRLQKRSRCRTLSRRPRRIQM